MPWTYDDPPAVARNWTEEEQRRCVDAANAVLREGGSDEEAIYACIAAAGKGARAMRRRKTFELADFKALGGEEEGTFEAIVAVFGNVDRGGDKIIPGAFAKSLERWAERGRPIPVIFSHQWENLDAHIGEVLEAREVEQGLYVKAQLDMEEDFARRVWKRMRKGTLAEFSFAYDVDDGKWVDGIYELRELDLLEVGPCLVGMNPETELLSVKGLRAALEGEHREAALQELHDMLVSLGATCAADDTGDEGPDGAKGEAGDGKPEEPAPGPLATRVAIELLESPVEE